MRAAVDAALAGTNASAVRVACGGARARAGASGCARAARDARRCASVALREDLCTLPGDPSVVVRTNVKMGEKKMPFMLATSRATAEALSKPESYVAVCALDGLDIIFGGSDAPCALCSVVSIGAINLANNKALSAELCELLGEFGIDGKRIYITFDDYARENLGYDGATFAG